MYPGFIQSLASTALFARLPRPAALLVVALAPLALVAGLTLRYASKVPASVRSDASRTQLQETARRLGTAQGLSLDAAGALLKIKPQTTHQVFALRASARSVDAAGRLAAPYHFVLNLAEPDGEHSISVTMNGRGDILQFETERPRNIGPALGPEAAEQLAKQYMKEWLTFIPNPQIDRVREASSHRKDAEEEAIARRFDFEGHLGDLPRLQFSGRVEITGSKVTAARVEPEFVRVMRTWSDDESGFRGTIGGLAFFLALFASIYSIRLYRKRSREKEVPRKRAIILILVFGLCGAGYLALNAESFANSDGASTLPWYVTLGIGALGGIFLAMGGVLVGAAYASGEGELREGYPDKLTSFDALLAGRYRVNNVAVSLGTGAVFTAWAFLVTSLACRLLSSSDALLLSDEAMAAAYGNLPWLSGLLMLPPQIAWTVVSGLFVPLTFVLRNVRRPAWKWTILLLCPFLISAGFTDNSLASPTRVLDMVVGVAVVLTPFFLQDVLAALVSSLLFSLAIQTSTMAALAPFSLPSGLLQIGIVTLGLAALTAISWRGESVTEDEVKPEYARNLDQRLSMQAEVHAAREAQLRLLPDKPPQIPGLSIAASCRPTGDVGADFYDFFPLPGGGLAVFVASGGGLGVASALTIALAKGFLMSDLRRGDSPARTLARLRALLTGRLGEVAQRARFAVATIDPQRRTFQAARWGEVPAVWILRDLMAHPLVFTDSPDGLPEAAVPLEVGDTVLFHTEGLISALEDQSPTGMRDWFRNLARITRACGALDFHNFLLQRLAGGSEKRLTRRLTSDLTAVVLRLEKVQVVEQEHVA
ncbi:PP2C family protein-serine/threonine phosphatase [Paludibaculum fermentans]|uniref:SpoIIE family protein phosphatase n=1 Tax=Paludibaculum fermentans TaxID=1473598 RepID=A0A7S7NRG1_PALFE|nr:SpoIIE family protein phosphatase [Paludibaculum fermentans]QOY87944.1 SpoIIE family protein phosphatase [Paludibaculum fermentans]